MKKKFNVAVIGYGKWGKKFVPCLKKKSNIKFILNTKNKIPRNIENLDWVFVLTNNKKHEFFVKYFLKRKINVFCEKPLTENFSKSQNLFKIAKTSKVKLYVSDIELYKDKKIKIKKDNIIIRSKFYYSKQAIRSILFKLFYHDIYLLGNELIKKKIIFKKIHFKNNILRIKIVLNNYKNFNFTYNLKSKNKIHIINKSNMRKFRGNPLNSMINKILSNKYNAEKNKKLALLGNRLIQDLLKK